MAAGVSLFLLLASYLHLRGKAELMLHSRVASFVMYCKSLRIPVTLMKSCFQLYSTSKTLLEFLPIKLLCNKSKTWLIDCLMCVLCKDNSFEGGNAHIFLHFISPKEAASLYNLLFFSYLIADMAPEGCRGCVSKNTMGLWAILKQQRSVGSVAAEWLRVFSNLKKEGGRC